MPTYSITVSMTYSTTTTANAVRTALNNLVAQHPNVTGSAGGSGTTVTFSDVATSAQAADAWRIAAVSTWSQGTRTAGFVSTVRNGD